MNKVSIITVCYNAEKEIENTIKSVYCQDYPQIEYIIKDGGSKDNTNSIIERYKSLFEAKKIELKHIVSEDQGIYDAMNQAVKKCNGDWIIFLNAGDYFYNNTVLTEVFEGKEWTNADVIYGHTLYRLHDTEGILVNHDIEYLESGWSLCHQSLFVRKIVFMDNPFDCKYRIVADYDQMLRLKRCGCSFRKTNAVISDVDRRGFSSTNVYLRCKENNLLKEKYDLKFKKKSLIISYLNELVTKLFPGIESYFFVRNNLKRTINFK